MKQQIAILVGLITLGLAGADSASAQAIYRYGSGYYARGYYGRPDFQPGLPPGEVMRIVRNAGFMPLSDPVRRGNHYFVLAAARGGGQVSVVVNAYVGDIMNVRPMMARQFDGPPPPHDSRLGALPPGYGEPPPPPGPAIAGRNQAPGEPYPPGARAAQPAPSQQTANAPAAIPPAPLRTPMPRPRPNVATNEIAPAQTAPAPVAPSAPAVTNAPEVPEAPPAPVKRETPLVPVAPLD